jgi:hypothetical protein
MRVDAKGSQAMAARTLVYSTWKRVKARSKLRYLDHAMFAIGKTYEVTRRSKRSRMVHKETRASAGIVFDM